MNDAAPFFVFDENWGRKLVATVSGVLVAAGRPLNLQHLFDYFPSGALDAEWVPSFAEKPAIIVSSDRGKRYGGDKLPYLLAAHRITHILVSKSLLHSKRLEKAVCLLKSVSELEGVRDGARGLRYRWRYVQGTPHLAPD